MNSIHCGGEENRKPQNIFLKETSNVKRERENKSDRTFALADIFFIVCNFLPFFFVVERKKDKNF